ncbi:MAG: DUF169 domain-containing protein [Candidatus Hodarchaeota archaeon]
MNNSKFQVKENCTLISSTSPCMSVERSDQISDLNSEISAFLCFGIAEQIRNLCSLVYFHAEESHGIQIPWGPSCASFLSYPTGMIKINGQQSVVLGPTDPTGNYWFPQNFMSMGIPGDIARQMAEDLEFSIIEKRPNIAYPRRQ